VQFVSTCKDWNGASVLRWFRPGDRFKVQSHGVHTFSFRALAGMLFDASYTSTYNGFTYPADVALILDTLPEIRVVSVSGHEITFGIGHSSIQEISMQGNVYDGVVVQNSKLAVANVCVEESKIVFVQEPFIAKDDVTASGMILAAASAKGVRLDDVTAPVEVKIRKYA
jgi:hypothetical protein